MENLPGSPFLEYAFSSSPSLRNISSASSSHVVTQQNSPDLSALTPNQLVLLLQEANLQEEVIYQLIKKRYTCEDLAQLVWKTFNAVNILLQEVMAVYRKLSPSMLTIRESSRACKALALFQVMAKDPEIRRQLIKAKIPFYFYPFLKPSGDDKPLESLRLTSLGVLGAFTKFDDPCGSMVLEFLLETEVVPLCLACMDQCDQVSEKVATLILTKILMQEKGMTYCCGLAHRFYLIVRALKRVVEKLAEKPCPLHLKYVIQCYLSFSEVPRFSRPCDAFSSQVPPQLFDNTFRDILRDDHETSWMLRVLHFNIYGRLFLRPIEGINNIANQDTTVQKAKGRNKLAKGKK